jgi:probable rRNA maturation factor
MAIDFDDATGQCSLTATTVTHWIQCTLEEVLHPTDVELAVRIVDADEGRQLNAQYRDKDYATNVLSFPAEIDLPEGPIILGDLVLCWPVVINEAAEQKKTVEQHSAHLIVHGTLHLLGRDHLHDEEAEVMEREEIGILQKLGYSNPYLSEEDDLT